jgi:GNAT superfamily N-acetyltransferase
MSGATVRAIRREDLPRVWELVHGLAEYERLTDMLTGSAEQLGQALFGDPPQLYGLVAEHGDRIVGYALFHFTYSSFRTNPRMWLEDLFVEPEARGTGAGAALLAGFCGEALAHGCHRVDWHVLDWNPARGFYEAQGATPSGPEWIQYGLDRAAMERLVADAARSSR